ncbi:MAG: DNA replication/repair protein RecF [Ruminococcaceae bacterium]|nr:DNA replication/repair protein RecF [Oscillospiraceae bacterium]
MICRAVSYLNFRNIENARIELEPGVNLLYGSNAEGKTNALEGIYLLAQGRSHRTVHEKEFIKQGENAAALKMVYADRQREQVLEMRFIGKGRKTCSKNGVYLRKMSEFIGNFRAVLFCPEHLSIVKSGPSERRGFADGGIAQLFPAHVVALQKYNSILSQRNRLIQNAVYEKKAFDDTIEIWSKQLSEVAQTVSSMRASYVKRINEHVKNIFCDMTGGKEIPEIRYRKELSADEYYRLFSENLEREQRAGITLYGPHKDDIEILLNGQSARSYASQGQQRSLAVALKLAEGEISKEESGEYPVFLMDDLLSELDSRRSEYLLTAFDDRQVIITGCSRDTIQQFSGKGLFRVEKGRYTKLSN